MNKIVCEVCGTSYPESSELCPICGCVRSGEPDVLTAPSHESEDDAPKAYNHVRGGRFSKANVKKRSASLPTPIVALPDEEPKEEMEELTDPEPANVEPEVESTVIDDEPEKEEKSAAPPCKSSEGDV